MGPLARWHRCSWIAFALLAATVPLGATSRDSGSGDPVPEVSWRRLEFHASKLMVKARAHVELSQHDAARAHDLLLDRAGQADHPRSPRGPRVLALEVGSSFLGRHSTTSLLLDPTDNAALLREQVETGKRQRLKLYRFCADGVYSRRVTPRDDTEQSLEPAGWTNVVEEHLDHQSGQAVVDPAALFYVLSVAEPKAYSGGQTLQVFSKGEVHQVAVRFEAEEDLDVRFDLLPALEQSMGDTAGPGIETVDRRVRALHYTLRPADDAHALELLGLEGELEIWIDAERRLPVLVTGKVSPVGRVAVKLRKAWLAR